MSTRTSSATERTSPHTFADPEDLRCWGCGVQVRSAPPAYWLVCDGLPVPAFSHVDRTSLCRRADGRVGEPIEVTS